MSVEAQTQLFIYPPVFPGTGNSLTYGVGDVDGDGADDFAQAAPNGSTLGSPFYAPGVLLIISGMSGATLLILEGGQNNSLFGAPVVRVDDIDGDGIDDIAVASIGYSSNLPNVGRIDVFSPTTGAIVMTIVGTAPGAIFGRSLARLGDLDGDGVRDIAVGSYTFPAFSQIPPVPPVTPESVQVFSGADSSPLYTVTGQSAALGTNNAFSRAICALDDIDGDGIGEFAVSEPFANYGLPNQGAIHIYSGGNGQFIRTILGEAWEALGATLDPIGDIDGDGFGDLLASTTEMFAQGKAKVLAPATGASLISIESNYAGWGILEPRPVDDVDGDGRNDIVVATDLVTVRSSITGSILATICDYYASGGPVCGGGCLSLDLDGNGIRDILRTSSSGSAIGFGIGTPLAASAPWSPNGDVLRINGSNGGGLRRVRIQGGIPIDFDVLQPQSNSLPAAFAVWGILGVPLPSAAFNTGSGVLSFTPATVDPSAPWLFTLVNGLGSDPTSIFAPALAPWSFILPNGLGSSLTVTLQGVIVESGAMLTTTNAIVVEIS